MIGEIRDAQTAAIALDAAYTGHLVLSSLHTPDVESTLLRLKLFELDSFLVAYCLQGVVSQSLKPIFCDCMNQVDNFQESVGCNQCNGTGIKDRQVVAESLCFPDDRRELVDCSFETLKQKGQYIRG
mgnify:CR=1 FL=1